MRKILIITGSLFFFWACETRQAPKKTYISPIDSLSLLIEQGNKDANLFYERGKLYFKNNITTAMNVSEARGVIIQRLTEKGVEPNEYTPLEIKMSVRGYGKADKKMVQQMVKTIFNMKHIPKPDDAADALACAICCAQTKRYA